MTLLATTMMPEIAVSTHTKPTIAESDTIVTGLSCSREVRKSVRYKATILP